MAKNGDASIFDLNGLAVGMGCCICKLCPITPGLKGCSIVTTATIKLIFSTDFRNSYDCIEIAMQVNFAPVGVVAGVAYSALLGNAYEELVVIRAKGGKYLVVNPAFWDDEPFTFCKC